MTKRDRYVYTCLQGNDRSTNLEYMARHRGRAARAFPGGKWRLNTMTTEEIQQEIEPDEEVLLVTETDWLANEDVKTTEQAEQQLARAGRRSRRGSFESFFRELFGL